MNVPGFSNLVGCDFVKADDPASGKYFRVLNCHQHPQSKEIKFILEERELGRAPDGLFHFRFVEFSELFQFYEEAKVV